MVIKNNKDDFVKKSNLSKAKNKLIDIIRGNDDESLIKKIENLIEGNSNIELSLELLEGKVGKLRKDTLELKKTKEDLEKFIKSEISYQVSRTEIDYNRDKYNRCSQLQAAINQFDFRINRLEEFLRKKAQDGTLFNNGRSDQEI